VIDEPTGVRTFLIADVRGYSRYTEDHGDEAAARLTGKFVELVRDGVEAHGGTLIEVRGDEGLAVFSSARQAIRAAVDLQASFFEESENSGLPLKVGIGIDSGEAVQLPDGSYRGAALNVAARLCGRAHGGEVIVSEGTSRLAGRLGGIQYSDRGRVHLKNIPEPLHILRVYSEHEAPPTNRWVLMFFGKPGRTLGWKLGLGVVLVAAVTAASVAYLTTGDTEGGHAAPTAAGPTATGSNNVLGSQSPETALAPNAGLEAIVPAAIWKDCHLQTVPQPNAIQTAVCLPPQGMPDRWEISSYRSGSDLMSAYRADFRRHPSLRSNSGRCNAFTWGGELQWLHGADKPGGRAFCYFDGNDAVIVWNHQRLGQLTHRDVLVTAREGGSDHVSLTRWWRPWHHLIGKAQ
jgi:class 3 adenylate cyclase